MTRSQRELRHKRPRLSKSADFDKVYRKGRSVASRYLVLYVFAAGARSGWDARSAESAEAGGRGHARLGVSVGRRVGGAVERNRVKRLLREAFWSLASEHGDERMTSDYVIVARPDAAGLAQSEGLNGLRADLAGLFERLAGPQTPGTDGGGR